MKKYIFFAVLTAFGITFAQSFGVRVGLNLNSAILTPGEDSYRKENAMLLDNYIGFHSGVLADIAINQFLYLQPGLMFTTKGGSIISEYEYEEESGNYYEYEYSKREYITSVYCIELPIMLSLKAPLSENLFLRANFGPYFDFGLSGTFKSKKEYEYRSSNGNNDKDKVSDSEDIYPNDKKRRVNGKAFNLGIGIGGGFEFNSYYFGLSYLYGITDVLDVKEDRYAAYDRTLSFTMGYNF